MAKEAWERLEDDLPADHFESETWAANAKMHEVGRQMPEGWEKREHFRGARERTAGIQSRRVQAYVGMYGENLGPAALDHLDSMKTTREIASDHVFRYSGQDGEDYWGSKKEANKFTDAYLKVHTQVNHAIHSHTPSTCGECAERAGEYASDPGHREASIARLRDGARW